jgi:hypothetical protein
MINRILEQGRANGLKFMSDCPTLVIYLFIWYWDDNPKHKQCARVFVVLSVDNIPTMVADGVSSKRKETHMVVYFSYKWPNIYHMPMKDTLDFVGNFRVNCNVSQN